jgi:hypothetical protein
MTYHVTAAVTLLCLAGCTHGPPDHKLEELADTVLARTSQDQA